MSNVNEESTAYLTVRFFNKVNSLDVPATATWEVHDKQSGTVLLAPTSILPIANTVELTLTPAINTLVDSVNNTEETRVVTVKASFGASDACNDEYSYELIGKEYVT
jgi:hypothetical protein